eukprot:scaffold3246_cov104-Skeletonema_dohrnii-CCMP3373.AAC.5
MQTLFSIPPFVDVSAILCNADLLPRHSCNTFFKTNTAALLFGHEVFSGISVVSCDFIHPPSPHEFVWTSSGAVGGSHSAASWPNPCTFEAELIQITDERRGDNTKNATTRSDQAMEGQISCCVGC